MNKLNRIFLFWKHKKKRESSPPPPPPPDNSVNLSQHQLSLVSRGPRLVYRNPAKNYEYAPNLSSLPSSSSLSSSTSSSFKSRASEVILLDEDLLQYKVQESALRDYLSFANLRSVDGEIHGSTSDLGSGHVYIGRCYSADDEASSDNGDRISEHGYIAFEDIRDWQKGNRLGYGTFGTSYEGLSSAGMFFAVKEVPLLAQGNQRRESVLSLQTEIELLSQFQNKNIVQYLGTSTGDENLYIFSELVTRGSLASLRRGYDFPDVVVSAYIRQILSGLTYLHSRNIVHGDIRCANILVERTGRVKLADFGLAKVRYVSQEVAELNDLDSLTDTAFWMAPEVVYQRNQDYEIAADIWSLGCTVLELATGQLPYHPLDVFQALYRIGMGRPPPVPESLTTDLRDFILKCLQVNPDDRPTTADLFTHPFLKRCVGFDSMSMGSECSTLDVRSNHSYSERFYSDEDEDEDKDKDKDEDECLDHPRAEDDDEDDECLDHPRVY